MGRFQRAVGALLLFASVAAAAPGASSAAAPNSPNILVIVTDDQRAGPFLGMPRTEEIFGSGLVYENAFATTPLCCPSRVSIFTGRYAHNHGVKYFNPSRLDQTTTVQSYLQANGYRTAIYGKYLNNWQVVVDPPFFDDWATFPQSTASTYSGGEWNVDGTVREVEEYSTDFIAAQASELLRSTESDDATPWFVYLAPPAPHEPYSPEPAYERSKVPDWRGNPAVFEKDVSDKPSYIRDVTRYCGFECGTKIRSAQIRTLMSVDDMVASVFGELEALGEAENTIAFYTSDNGLLWGEHNLNEKRPPYIPSIKVPLIMRWPQRIPAGRDERIVANIDIAPTILEAAGIPQRSDVPMDGMSLLTPRLRRELLLEHWEQNVIPTWYSIIAEDFQYIEYYDKDGVFKFKEYYDLEADPFQLTNLLRDGKVRTGPNRKQVKILHDRLREYRRCRAVNCP